MRVSERIGLVDDGTFLRKLCIWNADHYFVITKLIWYATVFVIWELVKS